MLVEITLGQQKVRIGRSPWSFRCVLFTIIIIPLSLKLWLLLPSLFYRKTNADNCKYKKHEELNLKGDISWGADVHFKNEALMATRLANFISSYLQVVDPLEVFPGTRVTDKPLTEDQMIGKKYVLICKYKHKINNSLIYII